MFKVNEALGLVFYCTILLMSVSINLGVKNNRGLIFDTKKILSNDQIFEKKKETLLVMIRFEKPFLVIITFIIIFSSKGI